MPVEENSSFSALLISEIVRKRRTPIRRPKMKGIDEQIVADINEMVTDCVMELFDVCLRYLS